MKYVSLTPLLLLSLVGCASDNNALPKTVAVPVETTPVGTPTDPNANTEVRNDEAVKTYPVGPYVDAAGVRHDAHDVERVEQSATWNLAPNTPTAINMGPAVAVADPNQEKQVLNGELQQQMVREQTLLKITAAQNDAMAQQIANLKARVQAADADKQSQADLKAQIQELQKQIDQLKSKQTSATPQKTPDAPRNWISEWFQSKPATPSTDSTSVASSATVTPTPVVPTPQPTDTSDMTGAVNSPIPVQTLPPVPSQNPVTTASNTNLPNQ
jgi:hypothetical protein